MDYWHKKSPAVKKARLWNCWLSAGYPLVQQKYCNEEKIRWGRAIEKQLLVNNRVIS